MSSLSYFSRFCHTLNSLIQLRMVSFGNLNDFDRLWDASLQGTHAATTRRA
jgi:hypothetical protein